MTLISSGHGLHVPGASCLIDEVTEARRVAGRITRELELLGSPVTLYHENAARNQRDNVNRIINYHNAYNRRLDVSIHFNAVAGGPRTAGIGTETLYRNPHMQSLASAVSKSITAATGLILRRGDGTWHRDNLGFLTRTNINRALLLEICFVNSREDIRLYHRNFATMCRMIANVFHEAAAHD